MTPAISERPEARVTRYRGDHSARILVVTPIYPWAGNPTEGIFVHRQVEQLRRLGNACHVVNYHLSLPLLPEFAANLSWLRYHPRWLVWHSPDAGPVSHRFYARRASTDKVPAIVDSISRMIEREVRLRSFDLIYGHWLWTGGAVGVELRERFGWPLAAIARGGEMYRWQRIHPHCREYVERVIAEADLLLANCQALANRIALVDPSAAGRVKVMFNGCDAHMFAPAHDRAAVRRRVGLSDGKKYMLTCATIASHKGLHELAAAWREFSQANSDWHLLVIGATSESAPLRDLQSRTRRVSLLGRLSPNRVRLYMQAADAYVQPSRQEGLANATMEAMATALPVISTDAGGQGEVVIPGVTGWLVPRREPTALAAAMKELALDPGHARRIGRAARRYIMHRFDPVEHACMLSDSLNVLAARGNELISA